MYNKDKIVKPNDNLYQIDSLDGARALAVLIVVWSHTSNSGMFFLPYFNGAGTGKSGVFLFFILSAYLLTRPFINLFQEGPHLKYFMNYSMRRVLRIFPLYTIYLLIAVFTTLYFQITIIGITRSVPFPLSWEGFWQHIFLQEGKSVTWSIPVEFKYYLVLPIFAYLYSKTIKHGFLGITIILLLSWITLNIYRHFFNVDFVLLHTITYAEIFILGSYAAAVKVIWDNNPPSSRLCKSILISALIVSALLLISIPSIFSALFTSVKSDFMHKSIFLFSVLWFFFLLNLIAHNSFIGRALSSKYLRYIGHISFSLYLIHSPIITIIRMLKLNPFLSAWLVLLISIFLSSLTYLSVERPLSRIKLKIRN